MDHRWGNPGVMSRRDKRAFAKKEDAEAGQLKAVLCSVRSIGWIIALLLIIRSGENINMQGDEQMKRRFLPAVFAVVAMVTAMGGVGPDICFAADAGSPMYELEPVVITAPAMQAPLETRYDPKSPQQPLPAQDGASFLKTVPGMSVIRKGGTDGDPVFRGQAGSRLGILLDGEIILGGCGNRMDPPTAYVYPETYDSITLIKGPQTVIYGPSNSAGVVLFDRDVKRFETRGWMINSSLTVGSFGRHDEVLDIRAGIPTFYATGTVTNSHSDNYQDGDSAPVHSKYDRWSAGASVGFTPDSDTRIEVSTNWSDGEAAYADRTMDGVMFSRENYGLKFEKKNIAPWLAKLEAQAYYNYIDHVMDNYHLRHFVRSMMMPFPAVSNPDRETVGGRLAFTLRPMDTAKFIIGSDMQYNKHTVRSTTNEYAMPYEHMDRVDDARFNQMSLFGEWTQYIGERNRVIVGMRGDWWNGEDLRETLMLGMPKVSVPNPTADDSKDDFLGSGFVRYEHDLAGKSATLYAGFGYTERFPDYWELIGGGKEGPDASDLSAFNTTSPEKTAQLDVGATWQSGRWSGFISGFVNKIEDFILVVSNVRRSNPMRTVTIVRNVDATTWGGEAGLSYAFTPHLKLDTSLAYVYGDNDTEDHPLAQIPPLEGRISLNWDNKTWSVGTLLRLVASQDRYAVNEGNIVGQDIGQTPGFGIFSINGGWRPKKGILVAVGIDNLFDKTYAEAISRSGAMVAGYEQTQRVNEPGRTFWFKASVALN